MNVRKISDDRYLRLWAGLAHPSSACKLNVDCPTKGNKGINSMMNLKTVRRIAIRGLLVAAVILTLAIQLFTASSAGAATTLPVLWTAGGLSAGNDSAGQAARMAVDASGNVAVVSGPAYARSLAVTSYTAAGAFRWQGTVSPTTGTFVGDWVAAAPNGDFVAVGHNVNSHGNPISLTLVRYAASGTLLWLSLIHILGHDDGQFGEGDADAQLIQRLSLIHI